MSERRGASMKLDRKSERGEGRIAFLISLAVLGVGIFVGVKIVPVRLSAYEFKDFMEQECRFAATRNKDEEIYKRVVDKAKDLHLPLDKKNLHLERTTHEMIISAKYQQTIDLKFTKYVFKFDHEERAPLF
jgi:predicted small metal-binding protein